MKWLKEKILIFLGHTPKCKHYWRPCVAQLLTWNERKPARICNLCRDWQPLTPEQFYSQFGENFYAAAQRSK